MGIKISIQSRETHLNTIISRIPPFLYLRINSATFKHCQVYQLNALKIFLALKQREKQYPTNSMGQHMHTKIARGIRPQENTTNEPSFHSQAGMENPYRSKLYLGPTNQG